MTSTPAFYARASYIFSILYISLDLFYCDYEPGQGRFGFDSGRDCRMVWAMLNLFKPIETTSHFVVLDRAMKSTAVISSLLILSAMIVKHPASEASQRPIDHAITTAAITSNLWLNDERGQHADGAPGQRLAPGQHSPQPLRQRAARRPAWPVRGVRASRSPGSPPRRSWRRGWSRLLRFVAAFRSDGTA